MNIQRFLHQIAGVIMITLLLAWSGAPSIASAPEPTTQALMAIQATAAPTTVPLATAPSEAETSPMRFVWRTPPAAISFPGAIAADRQGNIYIADMWKDRIQKFDTNGKFLTTWGSKGSGDGQFVFYCTPDCPPLCPPPPPHWTRCPHLPGGGAALDHDGNVLVSDFNGRIQKFDTNGKFLTKWGSKGSSDGQFVGSPWGLAVDGQGNIYVTDFERVQKFDSSGKFLTKWGGWGIGEGLFISGPGDIAVDKQGNVYVIDIGKQQIRKFDSNGKLLTRWGDRGVSDGQFNNPARLAVDPQGNIYVTDNGNHRVQKFDSNGKFLTKWGGKGRGDGQFEFVGGIAVDGQGNVYVGDINFIDDRVQKFSPR